MTNGVPKGKGDPIFRIGARADKQASLRVDGQWFLRVKNEFGHWGRWIACEPNIRPAGAWYDPSARRARLPKQDQ